MRDERCVTVTADTGLPAGDTFWTITRHHVEAYELDGYGATWYEIRDSRGIAETVHDTFQKAWEQAYKRVVEHLGGHGVVGMYEA